VPENKLPPIPDGGTAPPLCDKAVLVAVEGAERLQRILVGHHLTMAKSVEEAKAVLQKREFAMIILGVNFDESRMFELLRLVRTYKVNQLTPVVCMLTTESRLSDVAIEGLDHAVKAMLANAFLNLNKFPDNEAGNARVRRIIDYLILIDGDLHGGFEAVHDKS
jgi:PleD family two-component response regulator